MLTLEAEERAEVLRVYSSEVEQLQCDYDEHYVLGLYYLRAGEIDKAYEELAQVDSIGRQLTYIRSCLESYYKQVVYLH